MSAVHARVAGQSIGMDSTRAVSTKHCFSLRFHFNVSTDQFVNMCKVQVTKNQKMSVFVWIFI